jgi:F-type H+-transporting ATPase subunit b
MNLLSAPMLLAEGSLIDPQPGLAFWTLVTFVLVFVVLRWKVWGPLSQAIDEREKSIRDAVDQAKLERLQAEKLLNEQKLAAEQARKESAELVRQSQAQVEKAKTELFAQAKAEADKVITAARKQIEEEKRQAIAEIRGLAVDLALQAAGKLVSREMNDATHRALAEEYVGQVQEQRKLGAA